MKHLVLLLLLLSAPAVAQTPAPVSFTVKGKIGDLQAPATMYMLRDGFLDDKATLQHGTFQFSGKVRAPQSVMLFLTRSGSLHDGSPVEKLSLFVEPGPLVVTSRDSLQRAQVTGSPLTVEYQQLLTSLRPLRMAQSLLYDQRQVATQQGDAARVQRLNSELHQLNAQENHQLAAYIQAHPASYVSLDALQRLGMPVPSYALVAPLFAALAAPVRQSLAGQDYAALLRAMKAAGDTTAVARAVAQYDSARVVAHHQERTQQLQAFIHANPRDTASLEAVQELGGPNPDYTKMAPLFAKLAPTVRASPAGKAYAQLLAARKGVGSGQRAPDFTQLTPEGRAVTLQDYRGKYVLLDFWASWCAPCRAENPNLLAAYHAYQAKGFTILSISLDEARNRAKWLAAIKADQLPWTQVSDLEGRANAAAQRYQVQAIPQNFLVDPSGKIVATDLRGAELQAKLAQVLK
jgi:peroxiredoxin